MKKINYDWINWGPFVFKSKVDNYVVDRLLKDGNEIRNIKGEYLHNKALAGNLKEQYRYKPETIDWFYQQLRGHLLAYREGHTIFHRLKDNLQIKIKPLSLWVNYMKAGEFNPPHMHTADLSFVLFLTAPEELKKERSKFVGTSSGPGDVVFQYGEHSHPKWTTNHMCHQANAGDIIIFPASVSHWVSPFVSDVERVSVSGNMEYFERDKWPNDYF